VKLLGNEIRARALLRLAALVARGVPLDKALEAIATELPRRAARRIAPGVAAAREGRPLEAVLGLAGLASSFDRALVAAARDPREALELLGEECESRHAVATNVRRVLGGPLVKLVAFVLFGLLVARLTYGRAEATAENGERFNPVTWENELVGADYFWAQSAGRQLLAAAAVLGSVGVLALGIRVIASTRHGRFALEGVARTLPIARSLVRLSTGATFTRTLGTGLRGGLDLGAALDRCREALDRRLVASEVASAAKRAREGASIVDSLSRLSFLDPTAAWLIESASRRPDLPLEVLSLARMLERRFRAEVEQWAPFLQHVPEVSLLVVVAVSAYQLLGGAAGSFFRFL
jgi:general secretion pathway protein F